METDEVRVLTVRQPWAWAIIHGGKDVENRSWPTKHRGALLIHAGSAFEPDGYETLKRLVTQQCPPAGEFITERSSEWLNRWTASRAPTQSGQWLVNGTGVCTTHGPST